AGAERPRADARNVEERTLLGADHVRQQEHHHERDHDEVEVAVMRAAHVARFDVAQALPFGFHERMPSAVRPWVHYETRLPSRSDDMGGDGMHRVVAVSVAIPFGLV